MPPEPVSDRHHPQGDDEDDPADDQLGARTEDASDPGRDAAAETGRREQG